VEDLGAALLSDLPRQEVQTLFVERPICLTIVRETKIMEGKGSMAAAR